MLTHCFVSWVRRLCRPVAARKPVLALETLEDRTTPSVAPNALFVSSLYQGLLGRNADANGQTYWTGQLNAGTSRSQVAQDIGSSNEALNYDVQQFYDVLLNRPADAAGQNYWTGELKSGATLDQVKAGILGSNEFFRLAGNTNPDFVEALYAHELGRTADAAGLSYWDGKLNNGATTTQVADGILASPEAAREKVTGFYEDVLGRAPDAGGLNYWSAQLEGGTSETQVLAGLFGSNEYFGHVQNFAATATTDPNQAASNMIGGLNLFTGPLPNAEYLARQHAAPAPPIAVGRLVVDPHPAITPLPLDPGAVTPPTVVDNPAPTGTDGGGDTSSDNPANNYDNTDPNAAVTDNTDPNATDNTDTTAAVTDNTDPNAGVDNTYVDPNAGVDNTYVDPNANVDNTYVDPNAGVDNTYVDPNAGVDNTYVDPNASDGSFNS